MRWSLAILIFSIGQIGCSSSYVVSSSTNGECLSFSEFNATAKNENATILFQDSSTLYVLGVWAKPDSTSWVHPITGARDAVPTPKIKKIILTNLTLGALEGTGIGLLSGAAVGLLGAHLIVRSSPHEERGLLYIILPVLGGAAGLLTGLINGAIIGHTYEYEFVKELEKPFDDTSSLYKKFHLNLSPQEGYGIVLGFHGTSRRDIYEFGIAKTSRLNGGEGSFLEKYISLEVNDIGEPVLGFVGGADVKGFGDYGLAMNCMTDFSNHGAIFIRPHVGFSLIPGGNLHATFEYDIPIWNPYFYIRNYWMFGLRYNLGVLQRKKTY